MNKELLIILSWIVIPFIWGQMDKIKFCYETSVFSDFKFWKKYFDPHQVPDWALKNQTISWILRHTFLIGLIDFWHLIKGIILEGIIFLLVWLNGWNWGLFILLNIEYWFFFEISQSILNSKK